MRHRRITSIQSACAALGALLVFAAALVPSASARSLVVPDGEEDAIKACERDLCTMILEKEPKGRDLACGLQKTWAKDSLDGGKSKGMSWGFGDARCKVDLSLPRDKVIAALTRRKYTLRVPAHNVTCVVIRGDEERPVKIRIAPKLKFKKGRADKVWINLEEIDGPADVRATVWAAANLEDTVGVFHSPMLRSINKFIHRRCEQKWGENGSELTGGDKKKSKKDPKRHAKKKAKKKAEEGAND